jgi:hypothetical protein
MMEPIDAEKTVARPIEPVVVTMVGSGTGDGAPIPSGMVVKTPDHQPNLVVQVVTPLAAVLIRFANSYLTTLIGLVTVGLTTDALPAKDFGHLVLRCVSLSLAGPAVGFGKDIITILSGLEKRFPISTGNV